MNFIKLPDKEILCTQTVSTVIRASSVKLFENCPTQINLGTLHVELAFFFKVLGKCIDKLGAPYLLIESGALKRGSINGFIKGKSYKRGK